MGIWAMWVPIGGLLMYVLAPVLAEAVRLAGRAGGSPRRSPPSRLVVYAIVLRLARTVAAPGDAHPLADLRLGLSGRDIWLLVATFGLFAHDRARPSTPSCPRSSPRSAAWTSRSPGRGEPRAGRGRRGLRAGGRRVGPDRVAAEGHGGVRAGDSVLFLVPFNAGGVLLPVGLLALGAPERRDPDGIFSSVPEVVPRPAALGRRHGRGDVRPERAGSCSGRCCSGRCSRRWAGPPSAPWRWRCRSRWRSIASRVRVR